MPFRFAISLPLALCLVLSPASFAASPVAAPAAGAAEEADAPKLTREQETQVQFNIMAGELAAGRGQPGIAAQAFLKALELAPDAALAGRATQLALSAGDAETARAAARRWLELEPNSMDAREVLSRLALRDDDLDEVYAQSLEMIRGHAGGPAEGFRHVALLLSMEPEAGPRALGVLDRLVGEYPKLAGAHYARSLVALRFEQFELAEKSAREALRLDPESRDDTLLLIGVLVRKDELKEADTLVAKLVKQAKGEEKSEVRMTYARLLLDSSHREAARGQLRETLKQDPKNQDARYALGVMAFTDGDLEQAESMFTPLLADAERGGDAAYQLGRVAESRKQYEKALELYRRVNSGGQAIEAAVRQAAVMTHMGKVAEGRELLDQLRRQFPPLGPRLTLAEAEMLMDAGLNADALAVYDEALKSNPNDTGLLYGRSLVHEKMGKFPQAEADLRSILATNQEDARAMNALGYMLAVNTDRFEEARKLIAAALQRSPDDPAVIDSMGWVLYKLGQLEESRGYLEKALAKAADPEISAHLGEVLWALGQREQAHAVWDKALTRDPGHRVLLDTVERLTR
ncbi:Flp pilus assembly protein TadD [Panacagrimonas perspica]|uniref:Flp pilus assembly protein TadD n=1 Tax=Panacagrimonas perspica TaxID=381431 RepID=A0A4R7NTS0_9GAMM|nr:tetratricopeptide repeat protein [Panacagrimonas perspica]TDU24318.1 Flp pilus assembly protein TadD [Panacagrimonas perspica]